MKKIKYFMITGMLLASIGLAGCGKKSEDDITNKEIYQDDLEPLTEEELNEMDADASDEDMKQIDEPEEETADITDTTDATETTDKTENTDKAETSDSSAKKSADKTETSITRGLSLELLLRQPPDHISVIIRKEPRSSVRSHP